MSHKILVVASSLFGVMFLTLFVVVWMQSQTLLNAKAKDYDSLQKSVVPFNMTLFDNTIVSGRALKSLNTELSRLGYVSSKGVLYGSSMASVVDTTSYKCNLEYNVEGALYKLSFVVAP